MRPILDEIKRFQALNAGSAVSSADLTLSVLCKCDGKGVLSLVLGEHGKMSKTKFRETLLKFFLFRRKIRCTPFESKQRKFSFYYGPSAEILLLATTIVLIHRIRVNIV